MRGYWGLVLVVALLVCGAGAIQAEPGFALMVTGGTRGAGLELALGVSDYFGTRLSAAGGLKAGRTIEETDLEYDVDLKPESAGLLLDLYPGGGAFRFTAGVLYNRGKLSGEALPDSTRVYEVGGQEYTGAQLGVVSASTEFKNVAPYFGIGFGNPTGGSSRFRVTFDLGAFYQGKPEVSLRATNPQHIQGMEQAIAQEERDLEDELDSYQYYPVIMLGFGYRF